jgi:mannose-6-phosphate isomerase-like protein (cupin superfamily)
MTTHASPTLGSTADLSMWEVEMTEGASGPLHVFDSEQIWTALGGELSVRIAGETEVLGRGDTVVMPPELDRQIVARTDVHLLICGTETRLRGYPESPRHAGHPPGSRDRVSGRLSVRIARARTQVSGPHLMRDVLVAEPGHGEPQECSDGACVVRI